MTKIIIRGIDKDGEPYSQQVEQDIEKLEHAGVDRLFTPGATTKEIVDYIYDKFGKK